MRGLALAALGLVRDLRSAGCAVAVAAPAAARGTPLLALLEECADVVASVVPLGEGAGAAVAAAGAGPGVAAAVDLEYLSEAVRPGGAERERWPFALRDGGVEFVSAAAALAL